MWQSFALLNGCTGRTLQRITTTLCRARPASGQRLPPVRRRLAGAGTISLDHRPRSDRRTQKTCTTAPCLATSTHIECLSIWRGLCRRSVWRRGGQLVRHRGVCVCHMFQRAPYNVPLSTPTVTLRTDQEAQCESSNTRADWQTAIGVSFCPSSRRQLSSSSEAESRLRVSTASSLDAPFLGKTPLVACSLGALGPLGR